MLRKIVDRNRPFSPACVMLGTIYEKQGKTAEAKRVHKQAADNGGLPEPDRAQFRNRLQAMGKQGIPCAGRAATGPGPPPRPPG